MADEMMLMLNDDGVAHIYDETYDIVIHCESAEEQKEVEKRLMEMRWIPCSERLPEDYEDVLVWFEYFRYGDYNRMYSTHGIGTYSKQYDSWMVNHESGWKDLHILAWMPLPKPWEGEEDENSRSGQKAE